MNRPPTKAARRRLVPTLAVATAGSIVVATILYLPSPDTGLGTPPPTDSPRFEADGSMVGGLEPTLGAASARSSLASRYGESANGPSPDLPAPADGEIAPVRLLEDLGVQTKFLEQSGDPYKQVGLGRDGTRTTDVLRRRARYQGERRDRTGRIDFFAEQRDTPGKVPDVGAMTYNGRPDHFSQAVPSGMPLAKSSEVSASRGLARIRASSVYEHVTLQAFGYPSRPNGSDDRPPTEEFMQLLPSLEPIVRIAISNLVGERLVPSDDATVNGRAVGALRCQLREVDYYILAEWAAARGWSVGKPDRVPSVTLTKEGREVLLPLAAMQARVDGEWRDLGDCVAEKDGRWLVPATIDDLAR